MSNITASMVKELREKTGSGMMDCKNALNHTGGNIEEAIDWLRKKGLSAAEKKSGRIAAEGLIAISQNENRAAIIEVNSETDFVARNENFQDFVEIICKLALNVDGHIEQLKSLDFPGHQRSVDQELIELIAKIGENIQIRRCKTLEVKNGFIGTYIHSSVKQSMGKIGVLVALESSAKIEDLQSFSKQLAMHIAAASPRFLGEQDIDSDTLNRERSILIEQARQDKKPQNVIDKMVNGRIRKFIDEIVLLEQHYVISEDKIKVKKVITEFEKEIGQSIKLVGFVRFALGEGIERENKDFASEVSEVISN